MDGHLNGNRLGGEPRETSSISGGTRPADPIITEQLIPSVASVASVEEEPEDNTCEICYTNDKSIVLCWNSHMACAECRDAMWTMRDCFGQVKKQCGFCREKLFDWGASGLRDPAPSVHQPVRRILFWEIYRQWNNGVQPRITRERFESSLNEYLNDDTPDFTALEREELFGWSSSRLTRLPNGHRDFSLPVYQRLGLNEQSYTTGARQHLDGLVRARTFDIRVDDGTNWSMSLRVPLLHDRTRWFQYGATLTSANGRIIGLTDNMPSTHPDYDWLMNLGFSEDQVFYSPNFERQVAPAGSGTSRYKFIGRKGPWSGGIRIPFPQKSYSDHTIGPRCGHCRCVGHTADWQQNPRRSSCPLGNDKDLYRKERVDKRAIVQC